MKRETKEASNYVTLLDAVVHGVIYLSIDSPACDPTYLISEAPKPDLNFNCGQGKLCVDSLVQHQDLMKARQRINNKQKVGKSMHKNIKEVGKASAGVFTKSGSHTL